MFERVRARTCSTSSIDSERSSPSGTDSAPYLQQGSLVCTHGQRGKGEPEGVVKLSKQEASQTSKRAVWRQERAKGSQEMPQINRARCAAHAPVRELLDRRQVVVERRGVDDGDAAVRAIGEGR